jgi:Tfp pilus assembly protein PilZ
MDGMFISTNNPPPVGSHVNLIFTGEGNHDIEVTALVVWSKGKGRYRDTGMGVQFLSSLPQPVKKNILKNVDRVMILGDNGKNA